MQHWCSDRNIGVEGGEGLVCCCLFLFDGIDEVPCRRITNQYNKTRVSINFFRSSCYSHSFFQFVHRYEGKASHLPSFLHLSLFFSSIITYLALVFFVFLAFRHVALSSGFWRIGFFFLSPPSFSFFFFFSFPLLFSPVFCLSVLLFAFLSFDDGRPWLFNRAWWSCRISSEAQPSLDARTALPSFFFIYFFSRFVRKLHQRQWQYYYSSLLRLRSPTFLPSAVLITFDFSLSLSVRVRKMGEQVEEGMRW